MNKVQCRTNDGGYVDVAEEKLIPHVGAKAVVIEEDHVLLVPEWDGYDFPGGTVKELEDITSTLLREVKEETGLEVEQGEHLYTAEDFFIHPKKETPLHSHLHYYMCEVVGGELSDEGFEEDEKEYAQMAQWIPLSQIETLTFYNPVDSVALITEASRET